MTAKFVVGQRVIVRDDNCCGAIHAGYYGHITRVHPPNRVHTQPVYDVYLDGRNGAEAAPWMLSDTEGFNPFAFFQDELDPTD